MDFEMPVMNGPTATKRLREMECDCYIMGVTGNVMQQDTDVFYAHGANAVLAKPLRIEIFENMVRTMGHIVTLCTPSPVGPFALHSHSNRQHPFPPATLSPCHPATLTP